MIARPILLALAPGLLGAAVVAAVVAAGAAERVAAPLAPIPLAAWQPLPGDIVLTAADDLIGARIRGASGDDAIYSHVGLVVAGSGGGIAVVEATPFGSGIVSLASVEGFTTAPNITDLLVLRPREPIDIARMSAQAGGLADARIAFDYDLDTDDPSRLYCAELVFNLLREAGADVSGIRRVAMWVPFTGERDVIVPDAFAHAPQFSRVFRRSRTPG